MTIQQLITNKMKNNLVKYENANGDKMVAIITDFEENIYTNGFRISFRLYNITEGIGGFETTLCVANAPKSVAKMFCGSKSDYQNAAKLIGAKINSIKTDNKVGVKFQFSSIKKMQKKKENLYQQLILLECFEQDGKDF